MVVELFNTYRFRQIPKHWQTLKDGGGVRREDLDSLAVMVPPILLLKVNK